MNTAGVQSCMPMLSTSCYSAAHNMSMTRTGWHILRARAPTCPLMHCRQQWSLVGRCASHLTSDRSMPMPAATQGVQPVRSAICDHSRWQGTSCACISRPPGRIRTPSRAWCSHRVQNRTYQRQLWRQQCPIHPHTSQTGPAFKQRMHGGDSMQSDRSQHRGRQSLQCHKLKQNAYHNTSMCEEQLS